MTVIVTSGIEIRWLLKGIHLFAKPHENREKEWENGLFAEGAPVEDTRENRAKLWAPVSTVWSDVPGIFLMNVGRKCGKVPWCWGLRVAAPCGSQREP